MDWTTPLRSQQMDFIERLKSDCLLHCDIHGRYSELKTLCGDRFSTLQGEERDRQLGKAAIEAYLDDFVTEIQGDYPVDFILTSNPRICLRIKAKPIDFEGVQWSVSREEVKQNSVLVFALLPVKLAPISSEYSSILAGFLPTPMVELNCEQVCFGLDNLLYAGGLHSYLESLNYSKKEKIEISNASSLRHWLPELDEKMNQQGDPAVWKNKFVRWLQTIALNTDRENLKLHLYDLLNTQYSRQILWKLYQQRSQQIPLASTGSDRTTIAQQTDRQAEEIMLELSGLKKENGES